MKEKNDKVPADRIVSIKTMDVDQFLTVYTQNDMDAAEVYRGLSTILETAKKEISASPENAKTVLDVAGKIASGLRKNARKQGAMRFFYFGVFQENLNSLSNQLMEEIERTILQSIASRKHFSAIMDYLYHHENGRQSKIANEIGIDRSNLLREMLPMINAGIVNQHKLGHSRYYNLTPFGYRYYESHLKKGPIMTSRRNRPILRKPDQETATLGVYLYVQDWAEDNQSFDFINGFKKLKGSDEFFVKPSDVKTTYFNIPTVVPEDKYNWLEARSK